MAIDFRQERQLVIPRAGAPIYLKCLAEAARAVPTATYPPIYAPTYALSKKVKHPKDT